MVVPSVLGHKQPLPRLVLMFVPSVPSQHEYVVYVYVAGVVAFCADGLRDLWL